MFFPFLRVSQHLGGDEFRYKDIFGAERRKECAWRNNVLDAEVMKLVTAQLAFEKDHARELKPLVDSTENEIVKMFLSKIMLETTKHANMFQAMVDLDAGKIVWAVDKDRMLEQLKYHLKTEMWMVENIKKILADIDDKRLKPFLEEILADELRHHQILERMIDFLNSVDVTEQNWLDLYRTRLQDEWPDF